MIILIPDEMANIRNMQRKIAQDNSYDDVHQYLEGWSTYASHGNTFNLRRRIAAQVEERFQGQISSLEIDRLGKMVKS